MPGRKTQPGNGGSIRCRESPERNLRTRTGQPSELRRFDRGQVVRPHRAGVVAPFATWPASKIRNATAANQREDDWYALRRRRSATSRLRWLGERRLRNKNALELSVLRMLQSAIRNKEIEIKGGKETLNDDEIIEVIASEVKKRKEAVNEYNKAERVDLADKERAEIDILMRYMPKQMDENEIKEEVRRAIEEVQAESIKDLGMVMKIMMPRIKGRADGSLVNRVVREELDKE